jgi:hypothetical protein
MSQGIGMSVDITLHAIQFFKFEGGGGNENGVPKNFSSSSVQEESAHFLPVSRNRWFLHLYHKP